VDAVTVCSDAFRITADLGGEIGYGDQTPYAKTPLLKTERTSARSSARPDEAGSRMRARVARWRCWPGNVGGRALVTGWVEMPFAEVCDWFGVENTMLMLFDEPELVHEALSFAAELEIDFAKAQIDAGADLIGCGHAAA
jgi:uroporphyrinogen-III decarboxylase